MTNGQTHILMERTVELGKEHYMDIGAVCT